MKKISKSIASNKKYKKVIYPLAGLLLSVGMLLVTNAFAADEYDSIDITPKKVGVIYNNEDNRFQKFTAWGINGDEEPVDISLQVDWWIDEEGYPLPDQDTSPDAIATIDQTGLATVNSSWGRVVIHACYPKGCGLVNSASLNSSIISLLRPSFLVTSINAPGGTISSSQKVKIRKTATFTLTPDNDTVEAIDPTGDCPGGGGLTYDTDSNKAIFETGPIVEPCTVTAQFDTKPTFDVTGSSGSNGSISPSETQAICRRNKQTFTMTPDNNDYKAVDPPNTDCPEGELTYSNSNNEATYVTGQIIDDCYVEAQFILKPVYTVAGDPDTDDSYGTISVSQSVKEGDAATFSLTPNPNHEVSDAYGCNGTLINNDTEYLTGVITDDCTFTVHFVPIVHTLNVTATATGTAPGVVTSDPAGIECDSTGELLTDCSADYNEGTEVTLEVLPTPIVGSFTGWSGTGCVQPPYNSDDEVIVVSMSSAKSCIATFAGDLLP